MNLSENCFNDIVELVEFFITDEDSDLRSTKAVEGSKERHYKKEYYNLGREMDKISKEQSPYREEIKNIYQKLASNAAKRKSLSKSPFSPEVIELTKSSSELWKKLKQPLEQCNSLNDKIKGIQKRQDSAWDSWQKSQSKKRDASEQIKDNEEGK